MMLGLELQNTIEAKSFIKDTDKRLCSDDIAKNPFKTETYKRLMGDKVQYFIIAESIYPKIYKISYFTALVMAVFFVFGMLKTSIAFGVVTLFFACTFYLYTDEFFSLIARRGLKKSGYFGRIVIIEKDESIKRLLQWLKQKH